MRAPATSASSSGWRRSPATTPRPATSPRRCAAPSGPRRPPSGSTPTARPPTWPSGRSSCGRGSTRPSGPAEHRPRRAAGSRRPRARLDRRRPQARRGAAAVGAARARPRARPGALRGAAGAAVAHDLVAEPRRGGGGDGRARAGHDAARRRPVAGPAAAAGLAGPHASSCAGRFRQAVAGRRDGAADGGPGRRRFAEAEVLNTLGMAQVALGGSTTGSALAAHGDRASRASTTSPTRLATAYSNLADMLSVAGRTAGRAGHRPRGDRPRPPAA